MYSIQLSEIYQNIEKYITPRNIMLVIVLLLVFNLIYKLLFKTTENMEDNSAASQPAQSTASQPAQSTASQPAQSTASQPALPMSSFVPLAKHLSFSFETSIPTDSKILEKNPSGNTVDIILSNNTKNYVKLLPNMILNSWSLLYANKNGKKEYMQKNINDSLYQGNKIVLTAKENSPNIISITPTLDFPYENGTIFIGHNTSEIAQKVMPVSVGIASTNTQPIIKADGAMSKDVEEAVSILKKQLMRCLAN